MPFPTPHLDKLTKTRENEKLPVSDCARLDAAVERYHEWTKKLDAVDGSRDEIINESVRLLNDYRLYIDVDLVFDSEDDFLYRQKGQLKLDNSVVEEFLPRLIQPAVIPPLKNMQVEVGPRKSFSSAFFVSSLDVPQLGGGLNIREKNQDFAISKPLYVMTSHSPGFEKDKSETATTNITYVAAECKTNLDKTMFQEACATARDTKFAVSGAHYYLLSEWLDMAPLSTAATDIDEVILLRKAKRISAGIRATFSIAKKRRECRQEYINYLKGYPFRPEMFKRFVGHVEKLIKNEAPIERDVLEHGFF
ncbi:MAG: Bpu10I family restriction endonuclease [Candidatus Sulfotelmatobacter sp.]